MTDNYHGDEHLHFCGIDSSYFCEDCGDNAERRQADEEGDREWLESR